MPSARFKVHRRRWLTGLTGAAALVVAVPSVAFAAPPRALPQNAEAAELTYQPAFDYDTDGCYSTPAIGPDGTINGGLKPTGALNGDCHDASDLDNTNSYSRYKCNNGWCAYMYSLYFEKDQAVAGSGIGGHRNDWEHVVVWVQNNQVQYVSTSNHGSFTVHAASTVRFEGTHAKAVYHKDGIRTHCFRIANSNDEPPENAKHTWQYPPLVGWNGYPAGLRDKLSGYDFGSANFGLKDASFAGNLSSAKPSGIPFDPNA
ncbi:NPP1 family protein [Streptomyces sp. IBSBF 2953]|uniref:NPP1 family protein n=1 Tax=Streptomyces TaxID=1883 RepID=UPI002119E21E|nr:NPP1 family protein [Streptomyces scabiei]MCQ9178240.1 NPP1 family protein [Streptomyces hayashii]MDX3118448.1 NPP1 family protein [Streptomyces scabiei]